MYLDRWNRHIKLTRVDRLFAVTLEPLIPARVRPNHLTVLRLLLIPPVLYYLSSGNYSVGVPLFMFTAATDAFDGSLARTRKQITEWGIVYDPIADKMLIGAVLFVIVLKHINFYLGMALLVVEAMLITAGWIAQSRGEITPANGWGKLKMGAEVAGITFLLAALWFDIDLFVQLSNGTLAIALVAALVSVLWRMR